MSRRTLLAGALVSGLLGAACGDGGGAQGILLVTIDTCRADRIGCYGATNCETPAIDGLAERGVLFAHVTAPAPLTLPSHTSILTGLYPDRHGLRDNGAGRLPDEAVTIAEVLSEAGWQTAAFVAAVPLEADYGIDQGFALYDDVLEGEVRGDVLSRLHTDQRTAGEIVGEAAPWLRRAVADRRPFFAWVHFFDPHSPYAPPAEMGARYAQSPYEGEVAYVDRQIGSLLEALGEARDRTVVAVTADHGESLGEHGEASHGFLVYDSAVRVPWVMAGPGVPRGDRVEEAVSLVHVMPTLLAAVGVDPPPGLDGGPAFDAAQRGDVFAEALFPRLNFGWSASRSIRSGRWKYIEAPRPELYDLEDDADETRDLIADRPEVAGDLRERLHGHYARGGALTVEEMTISEVTRERLERLGYLGAGGEAADPDAELWDFQRGDPKEMVRVFDDMQALPGLIMGRQDTEARQLLDDLVARSPEPLEVFRHAAQLYFRAGSWESARELCERVLEEDPRDGKIRRSLGTALLRLGDREGAVGAFREAVRTDPDDGLGWSALGTLLAADGDCTEAAPALAAAGRLGVASAQLVTEEARSWEDCGDAANAEASYDRALALDAAYSPAVNGKALLLSHSGRASDAVAVLRAALPHLPDDVDLLNNLAWILADRSIDAAAALEHARKAAELAPEDPSVLDTLGWCAIRAGRPAEGVEALRRAWDATADAEVRAHLGVALAETGSVEEGRAHVRAAVAERPGLAKLPEVAKWR